MNRKIALLHESRNTYNLSSYLKVPGTCSHCTSLRKLDVMSQFCQSFHMPILPRLAGLNAAKFLTIFTAFLGDSLNPIGLACLFDFHAD